MIPCRISYVIASASVVCGAYILEASPSVREHSARTGKECRIFYETEVDKSRVVEAFLEKYDGGSNLVEIQGEKYKIVDIAMRMLTPRELYNAQGFPPDYIIDRGADGKPYAKSQQVAKGCRR